MARELLFDTKKFNVHFGARLTVNELNVCMHEASRARSELELVTGVPAFQCSVVKIT